MNWFLDRTKRFFWTARSPVDLAVCRILFYASVLALYGMYTPHLKYSSSAMYQPMFTFSLLRLPLFHPDALQAMSIVWKVALVFSCIGLLTRPATFVAAIAGFYLLGIGHCFGKIYHNDMMLVVCLLIMSLSKCGDALSLDRILFRNRAGKTEKARRNQEESFEYNWPIRLTWVIFSLNWFSAGFAKLRGSGLAWAFSDNMANLLIAHYHTSNPLFSFGPEIARYPVLFQSLALGALVLEVGAPLLLLGGKLRLIFGGGLLMMQLGIWFLMGIPYFQWFPVYIFLVPWEQVMNMLGFRLDSNRERPGFALPAERTPAEA